MGAGEPQVLRRYCTRGARIDISGDGLPFTVSATADMGILWKTRSKRLVFGADRLFRRPDPVKIASIFAGLDETKSTLCTPPNRRQGPCPGRASAAP